MKSYRRFIAYLLSAATAIILTSCRPSSGEVRIYGRVTYQGAAIPKGAVTFFPASGRPIIAVLTDGTYAAKLLRGEYDVVVNPATDLPPGWKEGDVSPTQKAVLPSVYTTRAKSKIKISVNERSDRQDFELQ